MERMLYFIFSVTLFLPARLPEASTARLVTIRQTHMLLPPWDVSDPQSLYM